MKHLTWLVGVAAISLLAGCVRPAPADPVWEPPTAVTAKPGKTAAAQVTPTRTPLLPPTRPPGAPLLTPTPDQPRPVPTLNTEQKLHIVESGETLGIIAQLYGVTIDDLVRQNELVDPNRIDVGQELVIPAATPQPPGPDFKIIPDSELVYSPYAAAFDIGAFIEDQGGYLSQYRGDMEGDQHSGAEILSRVATDYLVNPRLLLAVLDYTSGWVSNATADDQTREYPLAFYDTNRAGLYKQLAWAANNLSRGYYLWKANAIQPYRLPDGSAILPAPTINAGTAGVQYLMSLIYNRQGWEQAISAQGVASVFENFFGYPFDLSYEPLLDDDLSQPYMQLPFEEGEDWSFTGGPHGGWGDGAAWAGVDFAPPGEATGCYESDAWVTAVAPGLVLRSGNGVVVQDLDDDGIEQTGWTVLYLHLSSSGRVAEGTYLEAGDRIGHPSCEGGVSNGTHLHLARRYNGEWIPADGDLPFDLDGWISSGGANAYDGFLTRDGQTVEAYNGRSPENQIRR